MFYSYNMLFFFKLIYIVFNIKYFFYYFLFLLKLRFYNFKKLIKIDLYIINIKK